jgi:hypothetical protein
MICHVGKLLALTKKDSRERVFFGIYGAHGPGVYSRQGFVHGCRVERMYVHPFNWMWRNLSWSG